MSKKSLINRNIKRVELSEKYKSKREALFDIINNSKSSSEDKFEARLKLQLIPRNASPTRQRRRCALTGRPRGTFRKFGLSRTKIREIAMRGEIPGIIKASW